MRGSLAGKTAFFATACALLLCGTPAAEAGNGWGWKKPINQRMGAFYTSNKAFKKSKSSSSRYRSSAQYHRHSVTPTYALPATRTVTVAPAIPQPARLPTQSAQPPIPSPPAPELSVPAAATSVTGGSSAVTNSPAPKTVTKPSPASQPARTQNKSVEERALEILALPPQR